MLRRQRRRVAQPCRQFFERIGRVVAQGRKERVFRIQEDNEIIFFGADDAPQLGQMKHRFVAKYDYDGRKAADLRIKWWEQGEKEKWTFLFYHDIKSPMYTNES